jgi:hypothetical protein
MRNLGAATLVVESILLTKIGGNGRADPAMPPVTVHIVVPRP